MSKSLMIKENMLMKCLTMSIKLNKHVWNAWIEFVVKPAQQIHDDPKNKRNESVGLIDWICLIRNESHKKGKLVKSDKFHWDKIATFITF